MAIQFILLPLFIQVALTFVLLVWTARARIGALRSGGAKFQDTALGQPNWPAPVMQVSNCLANQFQLPVLFYLLVVLALITRKADMAFVVLAWLFVLSRLVHAYIHTGSNYVRHRFNAFAVGVVVLLAMWLIFAAGILFGKP